MDFKGENMKKVFIILSLIVFILSCTYNITIELAYCNEDADCGEGFVCVDGFCVEIVE